MDGRPLVKTIFPFGPAIEVAEPIAGSAREDECRNEDREDESANHLTVKLQQICANRSKHLKPIV